MAGEGASSHKTIETAYLLALNRKPSDPESNFCEAHLQEQGQLCRDHKFSPKQATKKRSPACARY